MKEDWKANNPLSFNKRYYVFVKHREEYKGKCHQDYVKAYIAQVFQEVPNLPI